MLPKTFQVWETGSQVNFKYLLLFIIVFFLMKPEPYKYKHDNFTEVSIIEMSFIVPCVPVTVITNLLTLLKH